MFMTNKIRNGGAYENIKTLIKFYENKNLSLFKASNVVKEKDNNKVVIKKIQTLLLFCHVLTYLNNNVLMNRPNKYLFKNFISIDLELTNSLHNKIIIKIIIRQILIHSNNKLLLSISSINNSLESKGHFMKESKFNL